jgi:phosphoribosylanthranilate isomerase
MTWVKICGMTNLEDALIAVDAGADAVGFVFYEKSPRCVSVEAAREIVERLPESVEKVGVFIDFDCSAIHSTVSAAGMTAVQLHGIHSLESVWQDPRPAIECVGVAKLIPMIPSSVLQDERDDKDSGIMIRQRSGEKVFAILIDKQVNGLNGGTGATFDWESSRGMIQALSISFPVIVAGGLTPSNVGGAMKILQPFGVDVVSGVEARPGKKDPRKVSAFVRAVREMDKKAG